MSRVIADPGPCPSGATPKEREKWRRDTERFLTEGGKPGVSQAPAKVDPTDARLKSLRYEHNRFLEMRSPFKAAIWLELLRPEKDVIHDAEMARRFDEAQQGRSAGTFVAPEKPAILGIASRLVASALRGDTAAISQIADRIEGKAGLRVGDEDPDDPAKRKQAQQITDDIIRRLTEKRLAEKVSDDAHVIDVTAEVVDDSSKDKVEGETVA